MSWSRRLCSPSCCFQSGWARPGFRTAFILGPLSCQRGRPEPVRLACHFAARRLFCLRRGGAPAASAEVLP
eukprot:4658189-Lingulodinium_polyedra.AAC.1